MQPQDYATVVVAVTAVIGSFTAAVAWLVKHYLRELTPNGGSSLNDAVNLNILPTIKEINDDVKNLLVEQATIKQKVEDHIGSHEMGHFKQ